MARATDSTVIRLMGGSRRPGEWSGRAFIARWAACASLTLGCNPASRPPVTTDVAIPAPPSAPSSSAEPATPRTVAGPQLRAGDTFRGVYTCRQGESSMRLRFTRVSGPTVEAIFEFEHVPTNVRGSFRMTGTFHASDGALELSPTAWIERPPTYSYAPISGHLEGRAISGKIRHELCGSFSVTLVEGADATGPAIFR